MCAGQHHLLQFATRKFRYDAQGKFILLHFCIDLAYDLSVLTEVCIP
jgi:hypothetical protein